MYVCKYSTFVSIVCIGLSVILTVVVSVYYCSVYCYGLSVMHCFISTMMVAMQ